MQSVVENLSPSVREPIQNETSRNDQVGSENGEPKIIKPAEKFGFFQAERTTKVHGIEECNLMLKNQFPDNLFKKHKSGEAFFGQINLLCVWFPTLVWHGNHQKDSGTNQLFGLAGTR
uniref:Uncharacterized protein n=1 Tax=Romanomermis culicivorax TaxID=13658 RepID=A0A915JZE7_ROMCU